MFNYETPYYEVRKTDNPFEIRLYENFYIVEYNNKNDPNINNGFGTLFSYIRSDNTENQKISMTVPVIEEMKDNKLKMAFVVPKKHWDKIPKPNNPNLSIKEFEKGYFAVIKYSGFSNKNKEKSMLQRLQEWIEQNNYNKAANPMLAFYNPPFTPPMFRRNEIMIRVEEK